MRSLVLHSFLSTYLMLLILLIIPSFSLVFKVGLVFGGLSLNYSSYLTSRSHAVSIHEECHFCVSFFFLVVYRCTPRFRDWSTTFPSLYTSPLGSVISKISFPTNSALSVDSLTWFNTTFTDISPCYM